MTFIEQPLNYDSKSGHWYIVKDLIEKGADIDVAHVFVGGQDC